jgi:hypothetical protein
MLAGIQIALRRAGIRPAVHAAPPPPFHGWGLALPSVTDKLPYFRAILANSL